MAYVTVLTTDGYLDGVLILNESLRLSKSRHRLYVLVGSHISTDVRETLTRAGIPMIESRAIEVPEEIVLANSRSDVHRHWANVFDKLLVFSLCQFRKIVYLDSDTLVRKNIDHLLERPHMSAVLADDYRGDEPCLDFNAGVMVIEPQADLTARLVAVIPQAFEQEKKWRAAAGRPPSMGVQSVLNMFFPEWISRPDLHLDQRYNVIANRLDEFMRKGNLSWRGPNGIHVLHFVGELKPWMATGGKRLRIVARLLARRQVWRLAAFLTYGAVLRRAHAELRSRADDGGRIGQADSTTAIDA